MSAQSCEPTRHKTSVRNPVESDCELKRFYAGVQPSQSLSRLETLGGSQKVGFQKVGFGGCSPAPKKRCLRVHSDVPRYQNPERGYMRMFPSTKNRNEGTFAKTALLPNHPFVSSRVRAKGVVLRERACFCLLSAFYITPPF